MARLRAYDSLDMSDFGDSSGEVLYADEQLVIVGDEQSQTGYFGRFSFDDNEWTGVITGAESYVDDERIYRVSGLNLNVRSATGSTQTIYRRAFSDDDDFRGSDASDYLAAYSGDDVVRGEDGNDRLQGMAGRDRLFGGSDRDSLWGGANNDMLSGGAGNDVLRGGAGNDRLYGGSGRDAFVFYDDDGSDRVKDFEDGRDRIRILDGADAFADLRVGRKGNDVKIVYDETIILLEDVARRDIDADDFTFG